MTLLFIGDVMLGRLVNEILRKVPPEYVWGDTLRIFEKADFRMCNLECVISDRGRPWSHSPKVFHFRSDAKNIAVLERARMNAVSLANNHVLDFEYDAMFEMLEILERKGILFTGAGKDIDEASKPAIFDLGGQRIGFLAFTDNEPDWEAGEKKPGIFYVPIHLESQRAQNLLQLIKETKKQVDFLIVSAHWGPNWGYEPPKEHIPFAHALIERGADVIFGHSGHVFRGIEIYKGKPILYCTGDFIDDYAIDEIERNDESFLWVLEFEERRLTRIMLYPTMIRDFHASLAKGIRAREIALKMEKLSSAFGTKSTWHQRDQVLEIVV